MKFLLSVLVRLCLYVNFKRAILMRPNRLINK